MLGIISFFSSTLFFSPVICLLLVPVIAMRLISTQGRLYVGHLSKTTRMGFGIIAFCAVLAVIVFLVLDPQVENFEKSLLGAVPYVALILIAVVAGLFFSERDVVWTLRLIVVEILVGIAEYAAGTHSFFSVNFQGETEVGDVDSLYFNRVFGLSVNSSTYAFKVLIAFTILLILRKKLSSRSLLFYSSLVFLGFVTSFSRTAIVAALVGLILYWVANFKAEKKYGAFVVPLMAIGAAIFFYLDKFIEAFSRGGEGIDLSGRDFVFQQFYSLFMENPILGNAARKVWLSIDGRLYHAHNSYLELLASNGFVLTGLFLVGYYFAVVRRRFIYAAPVLIYSVFQYGVFWGFVFHDIVFSGLMFFVLRMKISSLNEENASNLFVKSNPAG